MCIALNAMIASNTARAVLYYPLVLQTIIIAQMVSTGGKGVVAQSIFLKRCTGWKTNTMIKYSATVIWGHTSPTNGQLLIISRQFVL